MNEFDGRFLTKKEVQIVAKSLIGKTLSCFSSKEYNGNNKGFLGQLLEESVFNFANNSKSEPDFVDAGIELKLTPYKRNINGTLSAKERLVLNIIDYMNEYKYNFADSHFMFKNRNIQIIWYLYEKEKQKEDYKITNELLFSLDSPDFEKDREIIENDWNIIINKIKDGKAEMLSESDTMYLGACTKGANSKSLREQPFSSVKAMQRAFCYKQPYMTQLVRKYINNENTEEVIKEPLRNRTFEEYLNDKICKYYGKDEDELANELNIKSDAKNKFQLYFSKMLEVNGDIEESDEFKKANIRIKTIRVENNGRIKENMSFPAFKFCDIANEKWEESELYNIFNCTKFLFIVFVKNDKGKYVFTKIKIWNLPFNILDEEIRKVWKKTKNIISKGEIINHIEKGTVYNNFPKMAENKYCHVRPHAKDSSDTYPLPINDKLTGRSEFVKQCFWLNNKYIEEILGL